MFEFQLLTSQITYFPLFTFKKGVSRDENHGIFFRYLYNRIYKYVYFMYFLRKFCEHMIEE